MITEDLANHTFSCGWGIAIPWSGIMVRRTTFVAAMTLIVSALLFAQGYPPAPGYPPAYPPPQQPAPDQPGEAVARMSVMSGMVSVRRGDSGDWIAGVLNAPLLAGDAVSVGPGGVAEIQLDSADFVRIGGDSEVRISLLENGRNQIQIARGLVTFRMLRDSGVQSEISTPDVAVHPLRQGEVRVEVAPDGGARIIVRKGDVEASSARGSDRVHEGSMMLVRGSPDNPDYQVVYAAARDGWDNWNDQRDAYLERSQSGRYVSPDIYGTEDLDAYGRWGYDPTYGNVWTPNVPPNWAPYSYGQWTWEDYYGWTWVDYDPWGWAPFHYGSWYFRTGYGWSWFPGYRTARYWWHPAMAGFFGFGGGVGVGVGFGFGNVGWVALAPFEPFHPWYGPGWFGGGYGAANFGVFAGANIYNDFRNARVPNGVVAVSAADFQRGYFNNRVAANYGELQRASLVRGALPITPSASNLRFANRAVPAGPRADFGGTRFYSRMAPSSVAARRTSFVRQQAAVRSGIGSGYIPRTQTPGPAGWSRFGEPLPQRNGLQSGFSQAQRSNASGGSWNRFGSPQPAPQQRAPAQTQTYRSVPQPRANRGGGARSKGGRGGRR